jgi:hypothetical protein
MTKLTYDDLKFPNYTNTNIAVRLPAKIGNDLKTIELTLTDVVYAAELAGLNMLFVADTGKGKTQLISDIAWSHFGGDNGDSGNTNWADGRPSFEIEDLFVRSKVDLSKGYDSDTARQLKEERIKRVCLCVDELNRAPKPKQNEFFDLADGKYTFNGTRYRLGSEGYTLFLATANLNKLNGDFSGTFEFDRALLNRAHLTIDLDHKDFSPTPKDKIQIRKRKTSPRVDMAEPRDISSKIIEAHKEIIAMKANDPYMSAFEFLIDNGLSHCEKDKYNEKGAAFPIPCVECAETCKTKGGLCNLLKGSSERTVDSIAPLAYALSYIASLKFGKDVQISPFDAALQAFRFTTYHGNLNENVCREEYAGRKQAMMDNAVNKLEESVNIVKDYIPAMVEGKDPEIIICNARGNEVRSPKSESIEKALKQRNIPYTTKSLKDELKTKGIGTDWIDDYKQEVKKK